MAQIQPQQPREEPGTVILFTNLRSLLTRIAQDVDARFLGPWQVFVPYSKFEAVVFLAKQIHDSSLRGKMHVQRNGYNLRGAFFTISVIRPSKPKALPK